MSELTRLRDEAMRLLTLYEEHRNSEDEYLRRKVHVDLDRWLMSNRAIVTMMTIVGLDEQAKQPIEPSGPSWYQRLLQRRRKEVPYDSHHQSDRAQGPSV